MKFRIGMILGFVAGYILGAKAGTKRYEQIVRVVDRLMGNETVQKVTEMGKDYLGNGMTTASDKIRQAVGQ